MPGVREKHHLLRSFKREGTHPLSVMGDVAKAHRRIKILPEEWGMVACQLRAGTVWVNRCCVFGVASSAYWWSRFSGAAMRCVYRLLGALNPIEILLYADDLELLGADVRERRAIGLALFYFRLLGCP